MRIIVLFIILFAAACNSATEISADRQGVGKGLPNSWTKGAMVVAANPHAVAAAIEILEQGGHAVDAAIAAHTVLGLVEPQSSGIGGGGFMLVYDRASNNLSAYDGRETAPAGASEDMFMHDGKALGFLKAWQSGVSVGVPGAVAMYQLAHEDHGRLAWSKVFQPAIRLATDGFEVSPRLANMVRGMARPTRLDDNPVTAKYFYPDGKPLSMGHLLKNREYAETLKRIAGEGIQAFYSGDIAAQIVVAAQAEPNGGTLTVTDMENYRAIKREAVCGGFRNLTICAPPPPSSGFVQIMIAGLYDYLATDATSHSEKVQAFVDAQRLSYADRDHFVADPAYIDVPFDVLIRPDYIRYRAKERFAPDAATTPGDPAAIDSMATAASLWGVDTTVEIGGTTHLSIIDQYGNAVSLTASVEAAFGSSRWAGGFLLNNELTDFAKTPAADGRVVANAIAPGKRPRSSMSPIIVFDQNNDLLMVTGSPGGNSILAYVAKSVLGVLDWNFSAQQAVDYPNIFARGRSIRVEAADATGQQLAATLSALGYTVQKPRNETSGLHMIVVRPDGLEGGADKRREGTVGILQPN
ncbi:MAG: gamma-glutamyltransferase [Gammaproteobacteria bacterium]|jgi:gamma-glutamyltranspeptidase/glutathione hydrolase|nr:gamma-glutamyltransferase [Chromatiales bacterium]MDP6675618.1 gamma-glutamyltransferase [Gammaproteobacteria bacterium]